jgi:hypothetical protein
MPVPSPRIASLMAGRAAQPRSRPLPTSYALTVTGVDLDWTHQRQGTSAGWHRRSERGNADTAAAVILAREANGLVVAS